jgi:putative hydrolase of the HAD superfamily
MALVDSYSSIIFDFGGVLVNHQTEADQARMAGLLGVDTKLFADSYWSRRAEYDKGDLSGADYWLEIAQKAGASVSNSVINELTALDNESWMHFDTPMWEWLAELRSEGKRLALLSNMPRDLGEALKKTTRFEMLDQITLSYEVGLVKPDAEIYEYCLDKLGASAKDTVFFDDRIENIRGAEQVGIRAVQFLDRAKVLAEARSTKQNVQA